MASLCNGGGRVMRQAVKRTLLAHRQLAGTRPEPRGAQLSTSAALRLDISGIYPPIVTPFNRDESIAYDKLEQNVQKWNKIPFKGLVVEGSNGEYVYLSGDERVELVERVAAMSDPDKLIIAGAGCESTADTIAMCKKMAGAGAHAVLVVTPCYYKGLMSNDALALHYKKVADASPVPVILYSVPANTGVDLAADVIVQLASHPNIVCVADASPVPVILYSVPANTGVDLAADVIVQLASHPNIVGVADASPVPVILYSVPANTGVDLAADVIVQLASHPNIVGIKDSGGDIAKIGSLVYRTQGCDFQVLAGSASFLLASYVLGAVGGVLGLANVLGEPCCDLEKLFKQGDMKEAVALQHRLIAPNMAVTKMFGMPGLKKTMEWYGYYGGPCRAPIVPLSDINRGTLQKVFKENGFNSGE